MKVKCPECRENFDISVNDYEEGDSVLCPECSMEFTVLVKGGKFKLASEKEKFYEEEEFDDYFEE